MPKKKFLLRTRQVCIVLTKNRFDSLDGLHVGKCVAKSFIPEISRWMKCERDEW